MRPIDDSRHAVERVLADQLVLAHQLVYSLSCCHLSEGDVISGVLQISGPGSPYIANPCVRQS